MTSETFSTVRPGRVLGGRYVLVSRIAKGGMGEVWRVRDQRTGALVAAKVLRPELTGEEISLSRLRLEAKNAVRARHPNIAAVLDSGEDDGQGWIIMELIEGLPLTDYVGDGATLSTAQLIPILTQVAYALDASSQVGVVHRDIKPANIMIRSDGIVKLTDFGISFAEGQATLTAAGMVMGTAQYLAPEQAMGQEATTAGDFYSLGIIAFEALAGSRPFTGKTAVDIAMAHVKEEIPALPDDVPESMVSVVFSLLAKDPKERPQSGTALVRLLNEVATKEGGSTAPLPLPPPAPRSGAGEETKAEPVLAPPTVPPAPQAKPSVGRQALEEPVVVDPAIDDREEVTQLEARPTWRPLRDSQENLSATNGPGTDGTSGESKAGGVQNTVGASNTAGVRGQPAVGMWVIIALVVLTIVLIIIAMVRDRTDVGDSLAALTVATETTKELTWFPPAPLF